MRATHCGQIPTPILLDTEAPTEAPTEDAHWGGSQGLQGSSAWRRDRLSRRGRKQWANCKHGLLSPPSRHFEPVNCARLPAPCSRAPCHPACSKPHTLPHPCLALCLARPTSARNLAFISRRLLRAFSFSMYASLSRASSAFSEAMSALSSSMRARSALASGSGEDVRRLEGCERCLAGCRGCAAS